MKGCVLQHAKLRLVDYPILLHQNEEGAPRIEIEMATVSLFLHGTNSFATEIYIIIITMITHTTQLYFVISCQICH